jgi:hypothetical protein
VNTVGFHLKKKTEFLDQLTACQLLKSGRMTLNREMCQSFTYLLTYLLTYLPHETKFLHFLKMLILLCDHPVLKLMQNLGSRLFSP